VRYSCKGISEDFVGISGKLKYWREIKGFSQSELADLAGVPLNSLQNWEQGSREPLWSAVVKLAAALGVSTEDLKPGPDPGRATKTVD
jgi:transcriptional regulator with XRE-family HTH domain